MNPTAGTLLRERGGRVGAGGSLVKTDAET